MMPAVRRAASRASASFSRSALLTYATLATTTGTTVLGGARAMCPAAALGGCAGGASGARRPAARASARAAISAIRRASAASSADKPASDMAREWSARARE
ncbi:hypothetical protein EON68_01875 [archaeon]|nr:MAG: hypothetical protein EON68_01875 [archaeon]